MSNNLLSAFDGENTREVAARITYQKFPKPKGSPIESLMAQASPILRERFWFAFDGSVFDINLKEQVRRIVLDTDETQKLYEMLQQNPTKAIRRKWDGLGVDQLVADAVEQDVPNFIKLDFSSQLSPQQIIETHVPFKKLRALLLRASSAFERSRQVQLSEVRIVSAPRFDNLSAPVRKLLIH